jgi:hypothetical protein
VYLHLLVGPRLSSILDMVARERDESRCDALPSASELKPGWIMSLPAYEEGKAIAANQLAVIEQ